MTITAEPPVPTPSLNPATAPGESFINQNAVEVELIRSPRPKRKFEGGIIFLVTLAAFAAFGYFVVTQWSVISFEALDQLTRALMVWHNDPPNLAAVGFDYPPLAVLVLLPFTLVPIVASSLWALPLSSALFTAIAFVVINRTFEWMGVPRILRYLGLVLIALNPLVMFYGANGTSDMLSASILLLGISCLAMWAISHQVRYLISSGLAFSMSVVAGYDNIFWVLLSSAMIGVWLWRQKANQSEVQAVVVTFLLPIVYTLAMWVLFNWLILGDPFAWLSRSGSLLSIITGRSETGIDFGVSTQMGIDALQLIVASSAITFVVLPVLIIISFSAKDPKAGWLATFIAFAVLNPVLQAMLLDDPSQILLRTGLPLFFLTILGGAYIISTVKQGTQASLSLGFLAVIGVSGFISWGQISQFPYQNLEANFVTAVATGESQEGTTTVSGQEVGILTERAMAEYITNNITERGSVLTDNSQTFGVILLTGEPHLFFDRVDKGDDEWLEAILTLPDSVDYILVSNSAEDRILVDYPTAAPGVENDFNIVYETGRYALIEVTEAMRQTSDELSGSGSLGNLQTNPEG